MNILCWLFGHKLTVTRLYPEGKETVDSICLRCGEPIQSVFYFVKQKEVKTTPGNR